LLIWLLLLVGCGQKTDAGLRFEMERMLTKTDKLLQQFTAKDGKLSEQDLMTLVGAYSDIAGYIAPPQNPAEVQRVSEDRRQAWSLASLANMRIGSLYSSKRAYDKSYEYFKKVADNPAVGSAQRVEAFGYMAYAQERLGHFAEAAAIYDSVADAYRAIMAPQNPNMTALGAPLKAAEMWLKAGDETMFGHKMDESRDYFNQIMRKYPGTAMESAAIGKIVAGYLQETRYPEAIGLLKTVRDDSTGQPSASMLLMIAGIYMNNLKDYRSAENAYRDFIRYYPDHKGIGQARLGLALNLYQQKEYAEARKVVDGIERVKDIGQQTIAEADYLTALCYEADGKWELARGQFDLVQAAFPGTNQAFEATLHKAERYRSRGDSLMTAKAFNEALAYINKYIEENSAAGEQVSRALGYLVRAYQENGDITESIDKLLLLHQRYIEYPEGKFAPLKLSDFYENVLHDTSKAVAWLRAFIDDNPDADNLDDVKGHVQALESGKGKP
jgi:tetratricopeptide (TPR) repeat protein